MSEYSWPPRWNVTLGSVCTASQLTLYCSTRVGGVGVGEGGRWDYSRCVFYYFWWNARCMPLPRFRPIALRWFSSAETRRRLAPWCRRSPCQSQPCNLQRRTSSPSPLKCWGGERHSGKPRMASGAHIWPLHCIFTPSWWLPICPSLWCPCS